MNEQVSPGRLGEAGGADGSRETMAPGTHALIGWWTANVLPLTRRDRLLVFLGGVLPDLDGFGLFFSRDVYFTYHHVLCHNLLGCVVWAMVPALLSRPTHDDITADAVAKAFGVGIGYHPQAYALLEARYPPGEFNDMRKRMARVPDGATLVNNPVSAARAFISAMSMCWPGVPMVMRAMLEQIAPELPRGATVKSVTVEANIPEGTVAPGLARLQNEHPDVAIGSYPFYREGAPQPFGAQLVLRSRNSAALERTVLALEEMLRGWVLHRSA